MDGFKRNLIKCLGVGLKVHGDGENENAIIGSGQMEHISEREKYTKIEGTGMEELTYVSLGWGIRWSGGCRYREPLIGSSSPFQ